MAWNCVQWEEGSSSLHWCSDKCCPPSDYLSWSCWLITSDLTHGRCHWIWQHEPCSRIQPPGFPPSPQEPALLHRCCRNVCSPSHSSSFGMWLKFRARQAARQNCLMMIAWIDFQAIPFLLFKSKLINRSKLLYLGKTCKKFSRTYSTALHVEPIIWL